MPMIAMKQAVIITPASGGTDEWDRPIPGEPYTLKCRIQEGAKLTRSQSNASGVSGIGSQEVVSVAQIFFDRHPNIGYDDVITYTDEYGKEYTWRPLNIEVKRNLAGKPVLTVVSV